MKISEASAQDFPLIRELAYNIWPHTYGAILSAEQIIYMLELFYSAEALKINSESGQKFILIDEGDKICGFAAYEHHWRHQPVTRIHKIYVLPETQGKGFGKKLLDDIEKHAIDQNAEKLSLNVNRFNRALGFYEKCGFKIVAKEDISIGHDYFMEDYIMEKTLVRQV
ncbi:MAG TPA: GNAT family N-acetyltransferase [Flavobacterium sp.]|jgi:ribosomal protein S18 acetylase RimI-like enzyme